MRSGVWDGIGFEGADCALGVVVYGWVDGWMESCWLCCMDGLVQALLYGWASRWEVTDEARRGTVGEREHEQCGGRARIRNVLGGWKRQLLGTDRMMGKRTAKRAEIRPPIDAYMKY